MEEFEFKVGIDDNGEIQLIDTSFSAQLSMADELEKLATLLRTTKVEIDGGMMIRPDGDYISIWAQAKIKPKE